MKQLDFEEKCNEIMEGLKKENTIVLATVHGDKVAARTVYYVLYESFIYFVTSKAYSKYKQMEKNQNVALCLHNIQIEGIVKIKGHPTQKENKTITEYCIKKCTGFNHYIKYKNTVLIEVKMNKIEFWNNHGREYIDLNEKTAYRIG
jgi:uncharacterized pyridoxamine 5'-phosphate oxidase family protein